MDTSKMHKYLGHLTVYYETGMECQGLIFNDSSGDHVGPHWDVKNHPNETMTYRSIGSSIWFGNKFGIYNIEILNKDGSLAYSGSLTKDKKKISDHKYHFSFLPKEMEAKEWMEYCAKEYSAILYTNELTNDLKGKMGAEFNVGDIVVDDITQEDTVVLAVTEDKNKNIGYWVKENDALSGRFPHELSKINWTERWKKGIIK